MNQQERAKELAAAHWGYIDKVLTTHAVTKREIENIGFHYRTAMEHGYGHGVEDQRNGMFPQVEIKLVDSGYDPYGRPFPFHEFKSHGEGGEPITYGGTPTEEFTPWAKAERKASLCHSCHAKVCSKERITACEESGTCAFHISTLRENMLDAKQEAPTAAVLPLDFTLPSIALKCTAEEAVEKFESEREEWIAAKAESLHEMVELWDCLQALYTAYQRGADVEWYQDSVRTVMAYLTEYAAEGRDVMKARRGMLLKNAKRPNPEGGTGYYSPEVNAAIIASKGHRFQPLDEMGVI